jgi:hypothetical protein
VTGAGLGAGCRAAGVAGGVVGFGLAVAGVAF